VISDPPDFPDQQVRQVKVISDPQDLRDPLGLPEKEGLQGRLMDLRVLLGLRDLLDRQDPRDLLDPLEK
jgi:hypothetical protein